MNAESAIYSICEDCKDLSHDESRKKLPELLMLLGKNVKKVDTVWTD